MSVLRAVELPDFGREGRRPELPAALHAQRLRAAAARAADTGLDCLVVYADREHSASLAYLTGFDPRFEEALLLLGADGRKHLLVGNECAGYLPDAELGITGELFQDFSLPGQARDASRPLAAILGGFGIGPSSRVGCIGWKTLDGALCADAATAIEIPAYVVDALRELTGSRDRVRNANALFNGLSAQTRPGLRIVNEAPQIAAFEHASTVTSSGVLALLHELRPGVPEWQFERHLDAQGLPLSCHRMLSFGDKAKRGLASAGEGMAALGEPYTTAFGVTGALTCRAGRVAASAADVPADQRDFVDALSRNYFDVVAAWYGALRVDTTGGAVFDACERARDASLMHFALNPGHCLHLDEWLHSPFAAGSAVPLVSGMALQMDTIPVSLGPFSCINAEDGVVLADADLRKRLAHEHPGLWQRVVRRRAFMHAALGIALDESVLPLSNMPAWLPPYALDLRRVLALTTSA